MTGSELKSVGRIWTFKYGGWISKELFMKAKNAQVGDVVKTRIGNHGVIRAILSNNRATVAVAASARGRGFSTTEEYLSDLEYVCHPENPDKYIWESIK